MGKIWIIGGANIDICGASVKELVDFDSNIGEIELSYGGVGRNIAQACALLGGSVNFVTCFSQDHFGNLLKEECEKLGINCDYSLFSSDYPTSIYLAILNNHKDMHIGMSDMRILGSIDKDHLEKVLSKVNKDDILVLDSNLNEELIQYVVENCPCFIASDPVSVNKINKLKPVLHRLAIFKPNSFEAQALTGIEIKDKNSAVQALDFFLEKGIKEIIITLADQGILLGTKDEYIWFNHRPIKMLNATGGGDAFLGAYIAERMKGKNPCKATEFAIAAAIYTIESSNMERLNLSQERLADYLQSLNITLEELC